MSFLKNVSALQVEPDTPARMIVRGFNGLPLKDDDGSTNYIDVYSIDSAVARDHQRAVAKKRMVAGEVTEDDLVADGVDLLVALTAGWGSVGKDGKVQPDPEFSKDAARALYADKQNVEIRSQVDRFAGSRRNFSKASSSN